MSYKGSTESICKNGHYDCVDCYEDYNQFCHCGAPWEWFHSIDETNGVDLENPGTYPAPTEETGYDETWHMDPYGTRYAIRSPKHKPAAGSAWKKIKRL